MKKSPVALATLAVASAASAQSSLTMFGVVDVAVTYIQTTSSFVGIPGAPGLNFVGAPDLKQSQWSLTNSELLHESRRLPWNGRPRWGLRCEPSGSRPRIANDDGAIGPCGIQSAFDHRRA